MPIATDVSICSNALLMLGAQTINSLDDTSDRARLAANLWPSVVGYTLRRHPWNCAVKRVSLAPDAAAPAFGWSMAFTLPGDCVRVLSVGEDGQDEWQVESGKLMCEANPALVRYIWRNENPATWDDMLVHAMTRCMRAAFAYPVTASTSLEQLLEQELADVLRQARATDGQEGTPEEFGDSPLLVARLGRGTAARRWGW
jgi:hypothetical protein